ncbi:MAG: hypothetical protein J3K34DRAFT_135944 [Monoraphidium minutum]|nr:MAG: hypothetical protein J3K34DRAFT_135944 [Monoraphidium minutum]
MRRVRWAMRAPRSPLAGAPPRACASRRKAAHAPGRPGAPPPPPRRSLLPRSPSGSGSGANTQSTALARTLLARMLPLGAPRPQPSSAPLSAGALAWPRSGGGPAPLPCAGRRRILQPGRSYPADCPGPPTPKAPKARRPLRPPTPDPQLGDIPRPLALAAQKPRAPNTLPLAAACARPRRRRPSLDAPPANPFRRARRRAVRRPFAQRADILLSPRVGAECRARRPPPAARGPSAWASGRAAPSLN